MIDLIRLPDVLLNQILLNWIDLMDLSHLDVALCNRNYRFEIWNVIYNASLIIPMHVPDDVIFSTTYWLWIMKRRLCIKNVRLSDDYELSVLLMEKELIDSNGTNRNIDNERVNEISAGCHANELDLVVSSIWENLEVLNFRFLDLNNNVTDSKISMISNRLKKLKSLSLCYADNITEVSLSAILSSNYYSLTALDINFCSRVTFGENLFKKLSSLIELNIIGCKLLRDDYIELSLTLTRLENLAIGVIDLYSSSFAIINDELLPIIMPNFSKLHYLLIKAANTTGKGLIGVLPQTLKSLHLESCHKIVRSELNSIFAKNNITSLTSLSIIGRCNRLIDDFAILPFRHLKSLTLSPKWDDNDLSQLLSNGNVSKLEKIILTNNYKIQGYFAKHLHFPCLIELDISGLTNLLHLDMSYCYEIVCTCLQPGILPESLTELNLYGFKENNLHRLFSSNNLTNLTKLELQETTLTSETVLFIQSRCNNKFLDIEADEPY
eukprot:gene15382-20741_t